MRIAIQGSEGSYHEQVALHYFGNGADIAYMETFRDVFQSLRQGTATHAVIAIANNRYGFISDAYNELIARHKDVTITGESYLRVQHQLLGIPGATLDQITEVHSQAPALGQCHEFLSNNLPHVPLVEQEDTALSAAYVAKTADPAKAAIASKRAGELHGLQVIAGNIQDDSDNFTRFLILQPSDNGSQEGDKTTLLLKTSQKPGSLVDALILFKERDVNVSALHSSFLPNTGFDMQFFVEFDAGMQDVRTVEILQELDKLSDGYEVLGSYKSAVEEMK